MPEEYTAVSISKKLKNTVDLIVKTSSQYTSTSEFVKEAIRDKIKEVLATDQNLKQLRKKF